MRPVRCVYHAPVLTHTRVNALMIVPANLCSQECEHGTQSACATLGFSKSRPHRSAPEPAGSRNAAQSVCLRDLSIDRCGTGKYNPDLLKHFLSKPQLHLRPVE